MHISKTQGEVKGLLNCVNFLNSPVLQWSYLNTTSYTTSLNRLFYKDLCDWVFVLFTAFLNFYLLMFHCFFICNQRTIQLRGTHVIPLQLPGLKHVPLHYSFFFSKRTIRGILQSLIFLSDMEQKNYVTPQ